MIQASNIGLKYGDRVLLNNVSFTIKAKDRLALVGRNGAGKSTLLKILAGEKTPNNGNIDMPSNTSIGFLHQDIFIPEDKTILEEAMTAFEATQGIEDRLKDIEKELETRTDYETDSYAALIDELTDLSERFQHMDGHSAQAKAEKILKGLGFKSTDMDRMVKEFSGGWKMRIELAKILLEQPDYMLLDEPTNHLDIESILWLESFLATYPGGIIIISHDKTFLDNITTKTIEVELGNLYEYNCGYSDFLIQREERRAMLRAQFDNQQRYIADKQRTIDRFKAKANKAKMAQSMMKELDRMDKVELEEEDVSAMRIYFPASPRAGGVIYLAEDVVKAYGDQVILDKIELQINRGDKVAFVGQNGQGKTTLSKIIGKFIEATSGKQEFGHNLQVGYYAQDQADTLDPKLTLLETMENGAPAEMRPFLRSVLGAFMFSGEDAEKKVSVLSGGERARLAMAKLLLNPFNLLILDEPTNHLDIISKEILKEALSKYDGTMLVVSHDRDFLTGLTTRTIEFRDKKLFDYIGDVHAFLQKRQATNMREVEKQTEKKAEHKVETKPKVQDNEMAKLEKQIEKLEGQIQLLVTEMSKAGFYESSSSEKTLNKHKELTQQLEDLMHDWESKI